MHIAHGVDSRSKKMAIEKYCATRYQGVSMAHSQKPRENTSDTATQQTHHSTKARTTKVHKTRAFEDMIVDSGLKTTAIDIPGT